MAKKLKQVIERNAILALLNRPGAHIVTLTTDSEARMNKKGNPYYGARKLAQKNGIINWRYENAVNNQRAREGKEADFEAYPRVWGKRLDGQPWVLYHDQYYLELKVQRTLSEVYYLEDKFLDKAELMKYGLKDEEDGGRQELDKPVKLRDYRLDHICGIKFDGVLYTVKHELPKPVKIKFDELVGAVSG